MSSDRFMKWLYGYNTTTSSVNTSSFGNDVLGIIKSMQILEVQFGNLHASSPSSFINNMNDVINNMMMLNTSSAYDHPGLLGGSSSHSQQLSSHTNNVLATDGDKARASNIHNMKMKNEEVV
ncbi:hypothetical protein MtrunA17_Chr6g0474091 [Medicago truncatula]|nr:hypothetical protein MtrunA17_Chr6g0474091 [Medicago truncatula]